MLILKNIRFGESMFTNIKRLAEESESIKEARENVKKRSLAKEIIVFIGLNILIFGITTLLSIVPLYFYTQLFSHNDMHEMLLELFLFAFIIIVIILIVTKLEKRSLRSVGITKNKAFPLLLIGLGIGFIMFLIVVIIGSLLGQYKYNGFDLSSVVLIIPFFFAFLVQSFAEEFEGRGWAMTFISKRHSIITAIIVSNIMFALFHLMNPGINLLSIINIFLVGGFFSILFLKYDSIWVCGGAHTAWNFSQGVIFGFNVSGTTTPSVLKFTQTSQNFIGGGIFGPESSLIATIVIILASIIVLYYHKK